MYSGFGEEKKEEDVKKKKRQQMLAQGQFSSPEKKKFHDICSAQD